MHGLCLITSKFEWIVMNLNQHLVSIVKDGELYYIFMDLKIFIWIYKC
jgi:hypothetical protein